MYLYLYLTKKCDPGLESSFGFHVMRTVSKILLLAICSVVKSGLSSKVPSGRDGLVCCSMKNLEYNII